MIVQHGWKVRMDQLQWLVKEIVVEIGRRISPQVGFLRDCRDLNQLHWVVTYFLSLSN